MTSKKSQQPRGTRNTGSKKVQESPSKRNSQTSNIVKQFAGKSTRWRTFFLLLAIANGITLVVPVIGLLWAASLARGGVSGTEYIGLQLLPILFAGVLVAVVDLLSIGLYLYKHRPSRKVTWAGILVCVIAFVFLVFYGAPIFSSYLMWNKYRETGGQEVTISRNEALTKIQSCNLIELKRVSGSPPRLIIKAEEKKPPLGDVEFAANKDWKALKAAVESAPATCNYGTLTVLDYKDGASQVEVGLQKATEILQKCEGVDFYYGDQTGKIPFSEGGSNSEDIVRVDAEHSSTGIILRLSQGRPAAIHVADRRVSEMLSIAKQSRIDCYRNSNIWYKDNIDKSSL